MGHQGYQGYQGYLAAEHFVRAPNWEWWILLYFFFAGIAGGSYVLGALLRLWVRPGDPAAARTAFTASLVALLFCPIFLTVDLGRPERFWHMLIDTGTGALAFKAWSPMSVGAYGLSLFGLFAFVSAVESLFPKFMTWWPAALNTVWMAVGAIFGLFVAGYTGVLLAVSNQPVWSDGWPLGGLFLVSGLSGAAALLVLLVRQTRSAAAVEEADRWFVGLEAVLVVIFLVTIALAGTLARLFSPLMLLLWVLVLAGLAAPFYLRRRAAMPAALSPLLVLLGVLALRAVVIFGPQP